MKKNIILLTVDQFSYNLLQKPTSQVELPNIKELMSQGISFEKSYCTNPVCCPSRSSWATGLFSSENGLPFNDGELHKDVLDIGEHLSNNGYRTFHAGKWHVLGRELERGFKVLYDGQRKIDAGGAEIYDEHITTAAIDFLINYSQDEPFYLQVGYINPHDICEYLHSFEDKSKGIKNPVELGILTEEDLPELPENFEYDKSEIVTMIVGRRENGCIIHNKILDAVKEWNEIQWRSYIWYYYRLVEKVDLEIGKFLTAFKNSEFKENTTIIFTSDHGESCASHQMFQKFTLYEESTRVPLFLSTYGDESSFTKNTVNKKAYTSGVDLFKTICDIAEVDYPKNIHGKSLLHSVNHTIENQYVYIESNYYSRAIVSDNMKYIMEYIPDGNSLKPVNSTNNKIGREQLFDLKTDPFEKVNIKTENTELIKKYRKILFEHEYKLNQKEVYNEKGIKAIENWVNKILAYYDKIERS